MALRTYQAFSMGELLTRIRQDLGEQAVIIHTRTFKRGGLLGIGGRLVYEVTASDRGDEDVARNMNGAVDQSRVGKRAKRASATVTKGAENGVVAKANQADSKATILEHIDRQRTARDGVGGGRTRGVRGVNGGNGLGGKVNNNGKKKKGKGGRTKADDLLSALAELGQPEVQSVSSASRRKLSGGGKGVDSSLLNGGNRVRQNGGVVGRSSTAARVMGVAKKSRRPVSPVAKRFILDPKTGRAIPVNRSPQTKKPIVEAVTDDALNNMKGTSEKGSSTRKARARKKRTTKTPETIHVNTGNLQSSVEIPVERSSVTEVKSGGVQNTDDHDSLTPSPVDQGLHEEMSALRDLVSKVLDQQSQIVQTTANARFQESLTGGNDLDVAKEEEGENRHETLQKFYATLIEHEVASELADDICVRIRGELSPAELEDGEIVRGRLLDHLAEHFEKVDPIDAGEPMKPTDGRPLTMALIGATGVGKTTTVAKLAASYTLRDHLRVGLITTDTYRIAAVEQLRTYADIIGVPLKVAMTPSEMASACHALRDTDVILIDTAGRSPNDTSRIAEINSFITAAHPHVTHLVLSIASSEGVILRTIERFSAVTADRIIFTKLDEAVNFGVIVNVMRKVGKKLSFITTGQEVPDQIERGEPRRLARLILGESLHS